MTPGASVLAVDNHNAGIEGPQQRNGNFIERDYRGILGPLDFQVEWQFDIAATVLDTGMDFPVVTLGQLLNFLDRVLFLGQLLVLSDNREVTDQLDVTERLHQLSESFLLCFIICQQRILQANDQQDCQGPAKSCHHLSPSDLLFWCCHRVAGCGAASCYSNDRMCVIPCWISITGCAAFSRPMVKYPS